VGIVGVDVGVGVGGVGVVGLEDPPHAAIRVIADIAATAAGDETRIRPVLHMETSCEATGPTVAEGSGRRK